MSNTSSKKNSLPFKVGVTGGVGSGKSMVCQIFSSLGIPAFNADKAARDLYTSHDGVKKEMIRMFGPDVYHSEGEINRRFLASRLFNDPPALEAVNRLIHPLVRAEFAGWHLSRKEDYTLFESAILFETGFWESLDFTLLVTAPRELRIRRVMERDQISEEAVLARMRNQWEDEEKQKLASFIIINDEAHSLIEQILKTYTQLKEYGTIR